MLRLFKSPELRLAWLVALAADGIQILLLPLFVGGAFSPADAAVDLAAAVILSRLLGWHWAFLPTLLAELFPALDLFPTWTTAVFYVAWQRGRSPHDDVPMRRVNAQRFLKSN